MVYCASDQSRTSGELLLRGFRIARCADLRPVSWLSFKRIPLKLENLPRFFRTSHLIEISLAGQSQEHASTDCENAREGLQIRV